MTDAEAWQAYPALRWVYDRLQLAQALHYECGPAGTLPPRAGIWFVKPIINLNGMGVDAHARNYDGGPSYPIRPGNFWMPRFIGRHLSLDLRRERNEWQIESAIECIYRNGRPHEWRRVTDRPRLPVLIEMHLRRNHDFDAMPATYSAFPVWEGEPVPEDMVPDLEDADGFLVPRRLGFVYRCAEPRVDALASFHRNADLTPVTKIGV